MLRQLPITDGLTLGPGEYFVSFRAPDWLLDAAVSRPDWASEAARFVLERTGHRLEFLGGGVTWERVDGVLERTFSVRLRVHASDPAGVPTLEAGVPLRAIAYAVTAALGLLIALQVVRVAELVTDPERRPVIDATGGASWFALLVFGAIGAGVWYMTRADGGRWPS